MLHVQDNITFTKHEVILRTISFCLYCVSQRILILRCISLLLTVTFETDIEERNKHFGTTERSFSIRYGLQLNSLVVLFPINTGNFLIAG